LCPSPAVRPPRSSVGTRYLSPRSALSHLAHAGLNGRRRGAGDGFAASCSTRTGSGITPGTGELARSMVALVCMSTTFPSARIVDRSASSLAGWLSVAGDDAL
jgi:hypothetical protein